VYRNLTVFVVVLFTYTMLITDQNGFNLDKVRRGILLWAKLVEKHMACQKRLAYDCKTYICNTTVLQSNIFVTGLQRLLVIIPNRLASSAIVAKVIPVLVSKKRRVMVTRITTFLFLYSRIRAST
jgi:hypothetical protein